MYVQSCRFLFRRFLCVRTVLSSLAEPARHTQWISVLSPPSLMGQDTPPMQALRSHTRTAHLRVVMGISLIPKHLGTLLSFSSEICRASGLPLVQARLPFPFLGDFWPKGPAVSAYSHLLCETLNLNPKGRPLPVSASASDDTGILAQLSPPDSQPFPHSQLSTTLFPHPLVRMRPKSDVCSFASQS